MIVNLMYDMTLGRFEKDALKMAMGEIHNVLPELQFRFRGSFNWVEENRVYSATLFVQNARRIRRGSHFFTDVDDLVELIASRPKMAEPHIDILFTALELAHQRGARFVHKTYGAASKTAGVQSVAPYRKLCHTTGDIYILTKLAFESEVGRLLGALNRDGSNVDFCDDPNCAMGEAWTFNEMLPLAKNVDALHKIYCPKCLKAIRQRLANQPRLS